MHDQQRASIGFILRLGRAMHVFGYPAHRSEEVLMKAAAKLGLKGQFFSTPTSIFAAFGAEDDQRTYLIRVEPASVDLGKFAELDEITVNVLRDQLSPAAGSAQIETILAAPPRYHNLLTTIAYAGVSAAVSRFLGGGLKEIGWSALIGGIIGMLAWTTGKYDAWGRIFEPLAAFLATLLAIAFSVWFGAYAVSNAALAGLIVLMPGLTLTVAMIELTTQHLSSGTARLSAAFVVFLGMGFGVALGNALSERLFGLPQIARALPLPAWTELPAIVIASLAFCILLKAKPRDAIWIVLAGWLAIEGSKIGTAWVGGELGVFFGAALVTIASRLFARFLDRPAVIMQVPGILLLVPGSVGFRGLAALLDRQVVSGIDTTFKMILTATALVAGVLIANVVAPLRREI